MNPDRFAGNCKQLRGKVNEQWGWLTHDQRREAAGRCDQFAGRIQARRGSANEVAERQLQEFLNRNRNWYPSNR